MSVTLTIEGLPELLDQLRQLPEELTHEGSVIVERAATTAFNQISAKYAAHRHTGNLVEHMQQQSMPSRFGMTVLVSNNAKHAYWFENGTNARHYYTHNGVKHVVGRMPPLHAFIPPASRNRFRMYDSLKQLVEEKGMEVTGDATS